MNKDLIKAVSEIKEDQAILLVQQSLDTGEDPNLILADCQEAMKVVGSRFATGEYYLPELIASGEVVKNIFNIVKPKMVGKDAPKAEANPKYDIVLGTVRGDVHNIGKDIVGFLLDVNGYKVLDLGVDVPEEKFIEAIQQAEPRIVALSGLLTSVYDSMKSTVVAIDKAGLRGKVKVMIGGGQIEELIKNYVGADGWGMDAMAAVALAKKWIPSK
jgi:methanogenic corrinoid protein MtbC1